MVTVTLLPQSRPLTVADLDAVPDDGQRYELVDGTLIVTPSPAVTHQRVVGNLYTLLRSACPEQYEVMVAPLDVKVSDRTVLQPDLLVAGRDALDGPRMEGAPVLAVEVTSPSTRLVDRNLKRAAYESAGTASYWIVDPDGPTVIAWQREEAAYVEVATATGDEVFEVSVPYPVRLRPSDLLAR